MQFKVLFRISVWIYWLLSIITWLVKDRCLKVVTNLMLVETESFKLFLTRLHRPENKQNKVLLFTKFLKTEIFQNFNSSRLSFIQLDDSFLVVGFKFQNTYLRVEKRFRRHFRWIFCFTLRHDRMSINLQKNISRVLLEHFTFVRLQSQTKMDQGVT